MKFIILCSKIILYIYIALLISQILRIIILKIRKVQINQEVKFLNPFCTFHSSEGERIIKTYDISYLLGIFIIFGVISSIIPYTSLGEKEIGSAFEKSHYTTYYYVNAFPENIKVKNSLDINYRLIGEIEAVNGEYIITKAFFSNGDYLIFNDSQSYLSLLGSEREVYDNKGNRWYIALTNIKTDEASVDRFKNKAFKKGFRE